MTEQEQIIELNESKTIISEGDLVISKKFGTGRVTEVLYEEDVWNPIGVEFNGIVRWLDAKGGGTDTNTGDAKFYKEILK